METARLPTVKSQDLHNLDLPRTTVEEFRWVLLGVGRGVEPKWWSRSAPSEKAGNDVENLPSEPSQIFREPS
ncbi:hypothetical protein EV2_035470 [Malus domestica]